MAIISQQTVCAPFALVRTMISPRFEDGDIFSSPPAAKTRQLTQDGQIDAQSTTAAKRKKDKKKDRSNKKQRKSSENDAKKNAIEVRLPFWLPFYGYYISAHHCSDRTSSRRPL